MARSLVKFAAACRYLWHPGGMQRWLGTASGASQTPTAESTAQGEPSDGKEEPSQPRQKYSKEDAERFDQYLQGRVDAFERLTRRKHRAQLRADCEL